jgi:hypothetical protein
VADIKLYVVVRWLTSGMLDHVPTSVLDHCPKLLRLSRAGGEHAGREVLDGDGGALRDGRAAGNRLAGVELGRFAAGAAYRTMSLPYRLRARS